MPKQRSRRLRKKLHLDEFQEFGFEMDIELLPGLSPEVREAFVDAVLTEVIEPRDLAYGGGGDGGYVCGYYNPSATEKDREAVQEWVSARAEVASVWAHDLEDAWYPPQPSTPASNAGRR